MQKINIQNRKPFNVHRYKALLLSSVAFAALALASSPAVAFNECGVAVAGGTITCDGDGNPATDINPFANGIRYLINGLTLNVNGAATNITTGVNPGIHVQGSGGNLITINTAGTLTIATTGNSNHGILGRTFSTGPITINSMSTITTNAANTAHGIHALIVNNANTGAVLINANGGSINLTGVLGGDAINVFTTGLGSVTINSSINLTTNAQSGNGIRSNIQNAANSSATTFNVTGGTITTTGNFSEGIEAITNGTGALNISSAAIITTIGSNADGISVITSGNGPSTVNFTGGSIAVTGVGSVGLNSTGQGAGNGTLTVNASGGTISSTQSAGIGVTKDGAGNVVINSSATVTSTSGDGISAGHTSATGIINITVSGIVSSQSRQGIRTSGVAGTKANLVLNAGANVSSVTGFAIFNDESDSATTINTGATITGRISLSNGDDDLTFAGGSFAGVTLFDGGDDIFVADGFIDTLTFAGSSGMLTGANVINWERIIIGTGSTISFTDMALTAGLTTINNGGTFDAGNGFTLSSDLTLNAGGIFDATGGGAGIFSVVGTTMNGGTMTMQDGMTGDRLTIVGAYTGNGGRIHIDTVLGDDASATDLFVVNNGTAGTTTLNVRNAGGTGAATVAGIKVIEIAGGASSGTFVLDGDHLTAGGKQAIVGGAFSYTLEKQGNGNWHLISALTPIAATPTTVTITTVNIPTTPLFQPGSPVYEAYPQTLQALNAGQSYYQRVGSKFTSFDNGEPQPGDGTTSASSTYGNSEGRRGPFWGKVSGQYAHVEPDLSTTSSTYNIRSGKMQIGIDMLAHEGASGNLFFGVSGQYGFANADIFSIFGNGSIKTKAYGVGITTSWIAANGIYLDGQAHFNWFNSDLNSDTLGRLTSDNDGFGQSWSLEAGMPIEAGNGWMITPQAQLTYSNVRFEQFVGRSGELVSLNDGDSLIGRAGLSIARDANWTGKDGSISRGHFYGIANVYRQFEDGTETIVSGTSLFDRKDQTSGEIGLGFNVSWAEDKYSLYGDVTASTSLENTGNSYAYGGIVGFKVRF